MGTSQRARKVVLNTVWIVIAGVYVALRAAPSGAAVQENNIHILLMTCLLCNVLLFTLHPHVYQSRVTSFLLLVGSLLAVTLLVQWSGVMQSRFIPLYFLPLIFASVYFELTGAALSFSLICIFFGALFYHNYPSAPPDALALLNMRLRTFILVAAFCGYLAREKRFRREEFEELTQRIQKKSQEIFSLSRAGIGLNIHMDEEKLCRLVATTACELFSFERADVVLFSEDGIQKDAQYEELYRHLRETKTPLFLSREKEKGGTWAQLLESEKLRDAVFYPLCVQERVLGVLKLVNRKKKFYPEDDAPFSIFANQSALALENAQLHQESWQFFLALLEGATSPIPLKKKYAKGHAAEIMRHAMSIADRLDLAMEEKANLRLAVLFHDLGLSQISDRILTKPGKLTPEELQELQKHPMVTEELLSHIEELKDVVKIIRHCHEHYDGSGYPDKLKGGDIPKLSRILLLAESYCAMKSQRPYRAAFMEEEALEEIKKLSGKQFDPDIVNVFLELKKGISTPAGRQIAS